MSMYNGVEDDHDRQLREELGREPYEALCDKIPEGKLGIADSGYQGGAKLALPNRGVDDQVLHNFKSRARCRHETFNGRIKFYSLLQQTFRHGAAKHRLAFEAICVTVQYQMENGAELFVV